MANLTVTVNGRKHVPEIEPRLLLVHFLRDNLKLTGSHIGCVVGRCGACTVLMDGKMISSCLALAVFADGHEITTVEGLAGPDGALSAVQEAFIVEGGYQCGACTPGQVVAAEGLLRAVPGPSIEQIREGLSGNLCRCGCYQHLFQAVARAAELRKG